MYWPYFELRDDGGLYDEDGNGPCFGVWFESEEQAQEWLDSSDIRGTVK